MRPSRLAVYRGTDPTITLKNVTPEILDRQIIDFVTK